MSCHFIYFSLLAVGLTVSDRQRSPLKAIFSDNLLVNHGRSFLLTVFVMMDSITVPQTQIIVIKDKESSKISMAQEQEFKVVM